MFILTKEQRNAIMIAKKIKPPYMAKVTNMYNFIQTKQPTSTSHWRCE